MDSVGRIYIYLYIYIYIVCAEGTFVKLLPEDYGGWDDLGSRFEGSRVSVREYDEIQIVSYYYTRIQAKKHEHR